MNYSLVMRGHPRYPEKGQKAYACAQYTKVMSLDELIKYIQLHGSSHRAGDYKAIVSTLAEAMAEKLAEGYKVYRSTKKSKGFKAVATAKTGKTVKVTVKSGQKKGKTYYFKVRGYKKIAGKTCYSKYSKVVKVKAK